MIQEVTRILTRRGFSFLKVVPKEAGIFYRQEKRKLYALLLLDVHEQFALTTVMVNTMQTKLTKAILEKARNQQLKDVTEVDQVQTLILMITEKEEAKLPQIRDICSNYSNTWVIDSSSKQLLIFENQPGDFCGIRKELEEMLFQVAPRKEYKPDKEEDKKPFLARQKQFTPKKIKKQWKIRGITISLVVLNILVWLIMELLGDTRSSSFMLSHGGMYPPVMIMQQEWYRLFTSMFLHFGVNHLANNMLILSLLGNKLEQGLGKIPFLILYLLSGLGGSMCSYYWMMKSGDFAVSAGASGAIFGIAGGLLIVAIKHRGKFAGLTTKGMLLLIALILYFGFTSTGVDNWAHIGGVLTGVFTSMIFVYLFPGLLPKKKKKKKRRKRKTGESWKDLK